MPRSPSAATNAIDEECERLGIPKQFRPGIAIGWRSHGENAVRERRVELRRVAQTRIAAIEKSARQEIEWISSEVPNRVAGARHVRACPAAARKHAQGRSTNAVASSRGHRELAQTAAASLRMTANGFDHLSVKA
jgi:hypothetical protein